MIRTGHFSREGLVRASEMLPRPKYHLATGQELAGLFLDEVQLLRKAPAFAPTVAVTDEQITLSELQRVARTLQARGDIDMWYLTDKSLGGAIWRWRMEKWEKMAKYARQQDWSFMEYDEWVDKHAVQYAEEKEKERQAQEDV